VGSGHAAAVGMHDGPRLDHGTAGHIHGPGSNVAPGRVTATDPVCGMQVDPATAAAHRETGTGTVYFCSAGCAAAFDADSGRYAAAALSTAVGESTGNPGLKTGPHRAGRG
jgi:Cu+-exporting ATPase